MRWQRCRRRYRVRAASCVQNLRAPWRGTAEGEVCSTKGSHPVTSKVRRYRGQKRVGLLTRAERFFCRRGIFWRLCDISPPLLAFDFSVERRRGDPARFWYRRRAHARRVQTSAVHPRSDADARNRAKGRTEGGDQDAPTGGATRLVKGKKCTPAPAGSSRPNVPCVASAGRTRAR